MQDSQHGAEDSTRQVPETNMVFFSVTLFTDKNRQEPTRAVKSRQEAFYAFFD